MLVEAHLLLQKLFKKRLSFCLVDLKCVVYLQPLRAISSVGSEHLVYTERVGGSNPSLPTKVKSFTFM